MALVALLALLPTAAMERGGGCETEWWRDRRLEEASGAAAVAVLQSHQSHEEQMDSVNKLISRMMGEAQLCDRIADAAYINVTVQLSQYVKRNAGQPIADALARELPPQGVRVLQGSRLYVRAGSSGSTVSSGECVPLPCLPPEHRARDRAAERELRAGLWWRTLRRMLSPEAQLRLDGSGQLRLDGLRVPSLHADEVDLHRYNPAVQPALGTRSEWGCQPGARSYAARLSFLQLDLEKASAYQQKLDQLHNIVRSPVVLSGPAPRLELQPQVSVRAHLVLCAIPKNGWSAWSRFLRRMDGVRDWHNLNTGIARQSYPQGREEASRLFNDPAFLKVIIVRNPITRLLSAWLSKREDKSEWYSVLFTQRFSDFVAKLAQRPDLMRSNEHFTPQSCFCDLPVGARYDLVVKVEERMEWGAVLFAHLNLTRFAADRWGMYDRPCVMDGTGRATGELGAGWQSVWRGGHHFLEVPFGAAFAEERLRAHFASERTFCSAAWLYRRDIELFGYGPEVKALYRRLHPQRSRLPGALARCLAGRTQPRRARGGRRARGPRLC